MTSRAEAPLRGEATAPRVGGTPGLGRAVVLADGRVLGYDDIGDVGAPVVVYHHGFGSSRVVRHPDDALTARLGIRLIAVDRPGIGLSTGRPGRRLLDWPSDLVQLLDRLGIERAHVLGWSGGGPYALACGWAMPDRVNRIGLISVAAPLVPGADYLLRMHRVASRAADNAPWAIRLAMWRWSRAQRADPERHLDKAIEGMIEADRIVLEDPGLRRVMLANADEMYRQGGRGLYDEALIMARPWGFPIAGVQVPVRLWHGELDTAVPVGMGRYLARTLPQVHATFYPGEAHHLLYDRWTEIIEAFMAPDVAPVAAGDAATTIGGARRRP
ncbi:MAG: alpha/beta hydrolase [Chloroflexi bacterium]|nr:alpha/beta hydrolase [Chloroflexota bacterium]